MDSDLHFDGDPEYDSSRRHLERVLKGYPPRRKWPWVMAAVAGGGAWAIWRVLRKPGDAGNGGGNGSQESSG
jgi:hypothetical protein